MADGHFPELVSATRDANALTNPIFVQLTDGTTAPTLTGTSLNVNVTNASIAVTATNLDIRDLVFATDKVDVSGSTLGANSGVDIEDVTINNAAGASAVNIQDGGNSITVDGTVTANAGTGPFPVSDNGGSLTVDGTVTVTATDLDIRDLTLAQDAVKVSANSTANSSVNPIFVSVTTDVVSATEIHNYSTASAVASDTASNHNYTVAGTTFLLKSVIVASSGGSKVEIQTGQIGRASCRERV